MKKKLNIAICGFGTIGERHYNNLRSLAPKSNIIIVSKRKNVFADIVVRNITGLKKFGPIDAILICNETNKHKKSILQAIDLSPKAIFVEKPIALNFSDVAEIKRALRGKRIHFFVGYSRQFWKPYIVIRDIIKKKQLGKIYYMRVSCGQNLADWRKRDYKKTYSAKKQWGGGAVLDIIHEINFPAFSLGEQIKFITSTTSKVSSLKINAEDIAESIYQTESRAVVAIHQDCIRTPSLWSCDIVGSRASMHWDSDSKKIIISSKKKSKTLAVADSWNNMFKREMDYFLSQLGKKKIFSNLQEAANDMKNVELIKTYGKQQQ